MVNIWWVPVAFILGIFVGFGTMLWVNYLEWRNLRRSASTIQDSP